jgi:hypothetical protein
MASLLLNHKTLSARQNTDALLLFLKMERFLWFERLLGRDKGPLHPELQKAE